MKTIKVPITTSNHFHITRYNKPDITHKMAQTIIILIVSHNCISLCRHECDLSDDKDMIEVLRKSQKNNNLAVAILEMKRCLSHKNKIIKHVYVISPKGVHFRFKGDVFYL